MHCGHEPLSFPFPVLLLPPLGEGWDGGLPESGFGRYLWQRTHVFVAQQEGWLAWPANAISLQIKQSVKLLANER